jgi:hypothetical protein
LIPIPAGSQEDKKQAEKDQSGEAALQILLSRGHCADYTLVHNPCGWTGGDLKKLKADENPSLTGTGIFMIIMPYNRPLKAMTEESRPESINSSETKN